MISFGLLSLLFLYLYNKNYKELGPVLLFSFFFSLILYIIFAIEVYIRELEYFISDEKLYALVDTNNLTTDNNSLDRIFWFGINYIIINYDLFGKIGIKLINIPLLQILIIYLWKIFNKQKIILYISFLLPYLAFIATKDLRDILIFLLTVLVIYYFEKSKVIAIFYAILLYLLRPIASIITVLLLLIFNYVFKIKLKRTIKKQTIIYGLSTIFIFSVVLFFTYNKIERKIYSLRYNLNYKIEKGYYQERNVKLLQEDKYVTGDLVSDTKYGLIRYIFTPIPTSLIKRIVEEGGSEKWGLTDDVIRFFHQTLYFIFLFYILMNPIWIIKLFRRIFTTKQKILMYSFLIYWPLYAFHLQGVTNQRQKLPFQLCVFLLAVTIYHYKKRKKLIAK